MSSWLVGVGRCLVFVTLLRANIVHLSIELRNTIWLFLLLCSALPFEYEYLKLWSGSDIYGPRIILYYYIA